MNINQIGLDNKFKLVEASAGTGKSFTLAHLVLRNVLENKVRPEEILLLSFTKNTCSELREKILSRFKNLKLFLQNNDEIEIDNTLREWYLRYNKYEKSRDKTISEIDTFINEFYKLTKIPSLLNTSFNLHGEPIVETPEDAIRVFFLSKIDVLILNKYIIIKN